MAHIDGQLAGGQRVALGDDSEGFAGCLLQVVAQLMGCFQLFRLGVMAADNHRLLLTIQHGKTLRQAG